MGYDTDFEGSFRLDRRLSQRHAIYLRRFSDTRRMKRSESILIGMPDPARDAVNLPIGKDGEYFVGGKGDFGQDNDKSVVDHNCPPFSQPGLWCQWIPGDSDDTIEWNYTEKFYNYIEWLEYLIERFLKPWGYTLNGEVNWYGEDRDDLGRIIVENNLIIVRHGRIVYGN